MDSAVVEGGPALIGLLRDGAPDVLGALSLVLYVGSYLALQLGLIRGDGWLFPFLNLMAAMCLILSLMDQFNAYAMIGEIAWVIISVVGLARLYIVHRYLRLDDEEQAAASRLVPGLTKDRVRRLLAHGTWIEASPGHVLTREGQAVTHLVYVASGVCRIEVDGAVVATLGAGGLVGEMTYHTGQPATATVTVDAPGRLLAFERAALDDFLLRNEDIRAVLEQSVAGDLRRKLAATTRTLAEHRRGNLTTLSGG